MFSFVESLLFEHQVLFRVDFLYVTLDIRAQCPRVGIEVIIQDTFRPKKIGVFPLTGRKKLGSVGRKIFLFFYKFLLNKIRSKMFLWVTFH